MGKDLKGRKCGKGITQRKDGLYLARFVTQGGKRRSKNFKTLPEARNWLADQMYAERHSSCAFASDMTVDEWFEFWQENINHDLSPNTRRNYRERYERNIKPYIGNMVLTDVKPLHIKTVLNKMDDAYAGGTIRQAYIALGTMFHSAQQNELIAKSPMDGVKFNKPIREVNDIRYLTVEDQAKFLATAARSHNYPQYALLLETGLRTGEMIGLTWDAIDWERHTLTVNKTLEYRHRQGVWRAGPPKTRSSYRTIPLTTTAYEILRKQYAMKDTRKMAPTMCDTLDFTDRRTGAKRTMCMRDLVFVNFRTGEPNKNSSYDTHLYKLCDEAGIRRFCMHALRHTYATRAIERGVPPKTLQMLLGHSSIKMTMDRYVHVTTESLLEGVRIFENGTKMVQTAEPKTLKPLKNKEM